MSCIISYKSIVFDTFQAGFKDVHDCQAGFYKSHIINERQYGIDIYV